MQDIHTIREPLSTGYLSVSVLIIILILIIGLVFYILNERNKAKKSLKLKDIPKVIKIDYLKIAKDKIENLKKKIGSKNIDELFMELSFIVREYLSYKHNIDAVEMTASEIFVLLKDEDIKKLNAVCYRGEFFEGDSTKEDLFSAIKIAEKIIHKI